jgi:hypothetical protein
VNCRAAIGRSDRDVGFHAAFKGPARAFFRHSKANRHTFEGTTGLVGQLDGNGAFASGTGAVYSAFSFNDLNSQQGLRD